jgi:hypothetical protein
MYLLDKNNIPWLSSTNKNDILALKKKFIDGETHPKYLGMHKYILAASKIDYIKRPDYDYFN